MQFLRRLTVISCLIKIAIGLPSAHANCLEVYEVKGKNRKNILGRSPFSKTTQMLLELRRTEEEESDLSSAKSFRNSLLFRKKVESKVTLSRTLKSHWITFLRMADQGDLFCPNEEIFSLKSLAARFPAIAQGIQAQTSAQLDGYRSELRRCQELLNFGILRDSRREMRTYSQAAELFLQEERILSERERIWNSCKSKIQRLAEEVKIRIHLDDRSSKKVSQELVSLKNEMEDLLLTDPLSVLKVRHAALQSKLIQLFTSEILHLPEEAEAEKVFDFELSFGLSLDQKVALRKELLVVPNKNFQIAITGPIDANSESSWILKREGLRTFVACKPTSAEFQTYFENFSLGRLKLFSALAANYTQRPEVIIDIATFLFGHPHGFSGSDNSSILRTLGTRLAAITQNSSDYLDFLATLNDSLKINPASLLQIWSAMMERLQQPSEMVAMSGWLQEQVQGGTLDWYASNKTALETKFFRKLVQLDHVTADQIARYSRSLYFKDSRFNQSFIESLEIALSKVQRHSASDLASLFSLFYRLFLFWPYDDNYLKFLTLLDKYIGIFLAQNPTPEQINEFFGGDSHPSGTLGHDLKPYLLQTIHSFQDRSTNDQLEFLIYPHNSLLRANFKKTSVPLVINFLASRPSLFQLQRLYQGGVGRVEKSLLKEIKSQIEIQKDEPTKTMLSLFKQRLFDESEEDRDLPSLLEEMNSLSAKIDFERKTCFSCGDLYLANSDYGAFCPSVQCQKSLCESCLMKSVQVQINEGWDALNCPDCHTAFDLSRERLELLGVAPDQAEKIELKKVLKKYEKANGPLIPCPFPDCPYVFHKGEANENNVGTCQVCFFRICFHCCRGEHPDQTCDEAKKGEKQFQNLVDKNVIQFCPNCAAPSVRINACSSVTCRKCGRSWTYVGNFREVSAGWR